MMYLNMYMMIKMSYLFLSPGNFFLYIACYFPCGDHFPHR